MEFGRWPHDSYQASEEIDAADDALATESVDGVRGPEAVPSVDKMNNPPVLSSLGRLGLTGPASVGPVFGSLDSALPVSP
jgi:hypothetical protein